MTFWTDAKRAELAERAAEGLTSAKIAAAIGAVSRNAVISKCRALGVPLHHQPKPPKPAKWVDMSTPLFRAPPPVAEYVEPAVFLAPPPATAKPWLQRQDGECCFPVSGDGATTLFCCAAADRRGYCTDHRAVLYGKKAA